MPHRAPLAPGLSLAALPHVLQWAALLISAGLAGQLLKYWSVPAGQFLGPMLVAIGFGVSEASIRLPRNAFRGGQGVVGLLVAHSITVSVLIAVAQSWPMMLFATLLTILLSAVVGIGLARFGGIPGNTAAWGTSPGAASAMVSMAEDFGADGRVVATMQYVRVVCVVMVGALVSRVLGVDHLIVAPPGGSALALTGNGLWSLLACAAVVVFGVWIGSRVPAGALLVPLLLGGALQLGGVLHINLPAWLLATAYGAIGCYIGLRFDRPTIRYVWQHLPAMILGALALIVLCSLSAWLLALLMHKDFLSMYLATSPGGLDSMAIIAVDTHSDIGLVLAMQTLRLFGVIFCGSFLARQVIRLTEPKA